MIATSVRHDIFVYVMLGVFLCLPAHAENSATARKQKQALTLGMLPFMSPIAMVKRFSPLIRYLEKQTGQPIRLVSASNYPKFIRRTSQGRYDIVITAPHFVVKALDSGRYEVHAAYLNPLSAQLVVHMESHIRHVGELSRKVIALPPPEAIITTIGRDMLYRHGLKGNDAPLYKNYGSHNAAYQAVIAHEASAAIISVNVLRGAIKKGAPLVPIAKSRDFPGLGILTSRSLPQDLQVKIIQTLIRMRSTPEGKAVLRKIAYPGYRHADASEFEALRKYMVPPRNPDAGRQMPGSP